MLSNGSSSDLTREAIAAVNYQCVPVLGVRHPFDLDSHPMLIYVRVSSHDVDYHRVFFIVPPSGTGTTTIWQGYFWDTLPLNGSFFYSVLYDLFRLLDEKEPDAAPSPALYKQCHPRTVSLL